MPAEPEQLGTILGVWAHPDDETYLTAGIMSAAIKNGQRVVCVTATRGEEGSLDEEKWPPATMGEVREKELMNSLAITGVTEHIWLDYRDGTLKDLDQQGATARVQSILEEVNPDSVFSFGPEGMTGHEDHIATQRWTETAFENSAKPGAKLYWATTTPEWAAEFAPKLDEFNVFFNIDGPPVTPPGQLAIHYALPPDILAQKMDAIEAHESQVEGMVAAFGREFFSEGMKEETFRLGAED
ncbi:MAG: PIG-L family deacetylase [Actinomycetota bacterium]